MSITKLIVEKHGGHIGFSSEEGHGTTFTVTLPAYHSSAGSRRENGEHCSDVLIIEDDPEFAIILQELLHDNGLYADLAHSATDARMRLTQPNCYRLITLDIALPDQDGLMLMEEFQRHPDYHDIPIVIISGRTDEKRQELTGGAISIIDWLQKPFDEARFQNVIQQIEKNNLSRLLHVEDDEDLARITNMQLADIASVDHTPSLEEARQLLVSRHYDLVLLDVGLPDGSGIDLLDLIDRIEQPPKVVIFSANEVPEAVTRKVADVLIKSNSDQQKLLSTITALLDNSRHNSRQR